jgi:hypothetical protein
MRQKWLRVRQEHQAGALAKLVGACALCDELWALGNKRGGAIGAIRWERSRQEGHPGQNILFVSICCPHRLPQSLSQPTLELFVKRRTKASPPSTSLAFPGVQLSFLQKYEIAEINRLLS